ncbi:MAG: hypothetical protein HBSAPP03_03700 [Phycisphaerae bacterium]|nr:MAG: hypothetical protein HBSAPP03_03700 [Phycisphaerae bacterium]
MMNRETTIPTAAHDPRRMFERVLGPWAADMLELRRRGLDKPSHRPGWIVPEAGPRVWMPATDRKAA